ncbi:hypothetical protein J4573_44955 [Actinomadura barringtoniae]|uniref:DUF4352 domain-containing protein n=1 Tax=Actinomadura barringtoniae TaxID=1427535 RepID=A0A939PJZ1_9ACTN|nr:hypothetical protein [Actinomadura barringtoniae]MBO2454302.1 hypothetical protein [Actinomadura barringtoniae]
MNTRMLLVRGGSALIGTALLAAAMWLHSLRPHVEADVMDPIRTQGKVGKVVTNADFSLQVERVTAARSLAPSLSINPPTATDGIFLIVQFRATSRRKPLRLNTGTLETPGGYKFNKSPRLGASGLLEPDYAPLVWSRAAFLFELPKNRLAGARMVVSEGGLFTQLSAATDIDLGISKSRADEMIRTAPASFDMRTVQQ